MFSCVLGVQIKMERPYTIQAKSMLPSQVSEKSENPIYVWDSVILSFQSIEGANEPQSTDQMFILYLIKFLAMYVCIAKVLLVKCLKAPC